MMIGRRLISGGECDKITGMDSKELCLKAVEGLRRRRFDAEYCPDSASARERVMREVAAAESVGFGGSKTVGALGVADAAAAAGKRVLRHGDPSLTADEKMSVMRSQLTCDLFLLSANALTADGILVNIDGNGNRVAASIFGPRKVVFVVGRNKIVEGGVEAALARVHDVASPPNCARLSKNTPCARTGKCADCDSPDRICNVTVIMDRRPRTTETLVLVVDEDLGF